MSFFHNTITMALVFGIHQLNVSAQEEIEVKIDIEPRSVENVVDLSTQAIIKVAIICESESIACEMMGDSSNMTLAGAPVMKGGWGGVDHALCVDQDINGDGRLDVVCKFKTADIEVSRGQNEVELRWEERGTSFVGTDRIILK